MQPDGVGLKLHSGIAMELSVRAVQQTGGLAYNQFKFASTAVLVGRCPPRQVSTRLQICAVNLFAVVFGNYQSTSAK